MPSRMFIVYRYTYTPDDNLGDLIREQRTEVDPLTKLEYLPVTTIFLGRVVSLPSVQKKIKAEKINGKERRGLVHYLKDGIPRETNRYIPFNTDAEITSQIEEIKTQDNVLCVDYFGESRKLNR